MKIRRMVAELFRAQGQTDTTMLRVAFNNFANASKDVCEPPLLAWGSVTGFCEHDDEHPVLVKGEEFHDQLI